MVCGYQRKTLDASLLASSRKKSLGSKSLSGMRVSLLKKRLRVSQEEG